MIYKTSSSKKLHIKDTQIIDWGVCLEVFFNWERKSGSVHMTNEKTTRNLEESQEIVVCVEWEPDTQSFSLIALINALFYMGQNLFNSAKF